MKKTILTTAIASAMLVSSVSLASANDDFFGDLDASNEAVASTGSEVTDTVRSVVEEMSGTVKVADGKTTITVTVPKNITKSASSKAKVQLQLGLFDAGNALKALETLSASVRWEVKDAKITKTMLSEDLESSKYITTDESGETVESTDFESPVSLYGTTLELGTYDMFADKEVTLTFTIDGELTDYKEKTADFAFGRLLVTEDEGSEQNIIPVKATSEEEATQAEEEAVEANEATEEAKDEKENTSIEEVKSTQTGGESSILMLGILSTLAFFGLRKKRAQ